MPDGALLDLVDRVRQALRARADLFEIVLDRQAPPATPEEVAAAELSLGLPLPEILRDFYRTAGALFFEWEIKAGTWDQLGYEEDDCPRGILRIPAPEALARRGPGIAQITVSNGAGDGWALVPGSGGGLEVIWYDHERPDARMNRGHASVPELFAHLATIGFACDGDPAGIEELLQEKTKPMVRRPPAKKKPPAKKPPAKKTARKKPKKK